jgi:tripartite-type tricarboxylate transporter receptor subunit TctC
MKKQMVCWFYASIVIAATGVFLSFFYLNDTLAASYYQGKQIRIVVGAAAGGGYDTPARLLAKHLPQYIPGNPTIIIDNMVGASGMIAANHVYNIAKPDGLTIGTFSRALPFSQLVGAEGVKFDMAKYSWIGSMTVEPSVFTLRADLPYKTLDDLRKVKEPITIGCSGVTNQDAQVPLLIKELCGLNLRLVIYKSSGEASLAFERKEVDGRAESYFNLKPLIDRGLLRPWMRGRVSVKEIDDLPNWENLTLNEKGKTLMIMYGISDVIGRFYVAPPRTTDEAMMILRDAFAKVAKDTAFLADAEKSRVNARYTPGEEVLKQINFVMNQPPAIVKEFSQLLTF